MSDRYSDEDISSAVEMALRLKNREVRAQIADSQRATSAEVAAVNARVNALETNHSAAVAVLSTAVIEAKKGADTDRQAVTAALGELGEKVASVAKQEGPRGRDGKDGAPGRDGKDGAPGLPPAHRWNGTQLQFQRPDGMWGQAVDLRGPEGPSGKDRKTIMVRGGGASITTPIPSADGIELTGIVGLQGGQLVSLSTAQFAGYVAVSMDLDTPRARRADFVGDTLIYRGEAAPGADEAAPVWRIKRIEFITDAEGNQDVIEKWAGGTDAFVNVWSERGAMTYT